MAVLPSRCSHVPGHAQRHPLQDLSKLEVTSEANFGTIHQAHVDMARHLRVRRLLNRRKTAYPKAAPVAQWRPPMGMGPRSRLPATAARSPMVSA